MSDQQFLSSSQTYQLPRPDPKPHSQSPPLQPYIFLRAPPISTLEEFTGSSVSADGRYSIGDLNLTIAQASMADQELVARTNLAFTQLQEWYAEVSSWEWPAFARPGVSTGFEVPTMEERASKRRRLSEDQNERIGDMKSIVDMPDLSGNALPEPPMLGNEEQQSVHDEEYWGGCPARLVKHYQDRIDAIKTGVAELDLGDLQSRVLDVHNPSRVAHQYLQETHRDAHGAILLTHIDDLTAVITGTLLQALPYLARLSRLLETWSIRLSVLRNVPYFLKDLGDAQIAMHSAWRAIGLSGQRKRDVGKVQTGHIPAADKDLSVIDAARPTEAQAGTQFAQSDLMIDGFRTIDKVLGRKIVSAGQKLDSMLDALEGKEDTLPEEWIQEMERLEAEYSDWVCGAERIVFENELRKGHIDVNSVKLQLEPSTERRLDASQANNIYPTDLERQVTAPDEKTLRQSTAQECLPTAINPDDNQFANLNGSLDHPQTLNAKGLERATSSAVYSPSTKMSQINRSSTDPARETLHTFKDPHTNRNIPPGTDRSHVDGSLQRPLASDLHTRQFGQDTALRPKSAPPKLPHGALALGRHKSHQKDSTEKMAQYASWSDLTATDSLNQYPLKPVNDVDIRYNFSISKNRSGPYQKEYGHRNSRGLQGLPSLRLNVSGDLQNKTDSRSLPSSPELPGSQGSPMSKRPAAIIVEDSVKDSITAPSSASSYLSDLSSPELQDAFAAIVGKPVIVTSRPASFAGPFTHVENQVTDDRAWSQVRGGEHSDENTMTQRRERSKHSYSQSLNHQYPDNGWHDNDSEEEDPDMLTPRRASVISMTSLEIVDKGSIKSIEVRKRRSQPALASTPTKKLQQVSHPSPHLLSIRTGRPRNSSASEVVGSLTLKDMNPTSSVNPSSGLADQSSVSDKSSKTQSMPKRQVKSPNKEYVLRTANIGPSGNSSDKLDSNAKSPTRKSQDISREEQLEQKISSILTTIPAHIRLTSEDDPAVIGSSKQTRSGTPSGPRSRKTPTPPPNSYTLAPAKTQNVGGSRATANNSEVRLYHLRRGGADGSSQPPIKLFVRLVGSENNERVMVRVGGGWSELGDYLREYAIHHNTNRRTISGGDDGLMEVKQLPITSINSTGTPSTSRQYNINKEKENGGRVTPGPTNNNINSSQVGGGGQRSSRRSVSSSIPGTPITPSPNTLVTNNTATPASISSRPASTTRPRSHLFSSHQSTTTDVENRPNSSSNPAPTTPIITSNLSRSSSTGKVKRPFSLSNHNNSNRLSAEKQAWVEAMIGRVKRSTTSKASTMTTTISTPPTTPITTPHQSNTNIKNTTTTSFTPTNTNNHSKNTTTTTTTTASTPISTTTIIHKNTTAFTNPSSSRTSSRDGGESIPSSSFTDPDPDPSHNPPPPEFSSTSLSSSDTKNTNTNMMDMDIITFGDLGTVGRGSGSGSGSGSGTSGVALGSSSGGGGGGGGGGIRRVFPRRQPSTSTS